MKLTKLPSGELYVQKGRYHTPDSFTFRAGINSKSINIGHITVPEELEGKYFRLKVEVFEKPKHKEETR